MVLHKKHLVIKRSNIPQAGKGLFAKRFISKGTFIAEYKGIRKTWKEVSEGKHFNAYIYYLTRNHVIDAKSYKKSLARYTNDAEGLNKLKGLKNNSAYIEQKDKVYIQALKDIPEGSEIFVSYGKEYWDIIKHNMKLALV
jgi:uncharacterized protein